MEDSYLFDDVFCIPHEGQYIIYLPLRGIILLGNTTFVNLLYQARLGDEAALKQLGVDEGLIAELFESQQQLKHLTRPRPLPPFKPTSISIFLTHDCTMRCVYCYAEGGKSTASMPWETITGVLDEILQNTLSANSKQMTVNFHGGDVSAVWPLFVHTREYAQRITEPHGIRVRTSVGLNGYLNKEQREWIVQNIDGATLSVDGTPDIQNAQRPLLPGKGLSSDYISETLHALDAANFSYGIRSTVTAESVDRLEESIAYFCEHFKAKKIKAEPMYPRGRGAGIVRAPYAETFVKHFRNARDIARQNGRELSYSGARMEVLTNVFCQAAGGSCAVTPEGWVTSCYEVLDTTDPLSDVFFYGQYDPQTRKMVVDDAKRQRLFNLSVLQKPYCAKCFCKWHCAGDCPVKALHAEDSPSPDLPDRCYINRELTKDQLIEALN